jgi:hypothetical protein
LRETHATEAVFFFLIVVLEDASRRWADSFSAGGRFQTISPKKTLEGTLRESPPVSPARSFPDAYADSLAGPRHLPS